jgi:hypothetical protein
MKPEELSNYIKKIRELEYNLQVEDRLLVKLDGKCLISKAGTELYKLGTEDFSEVTDEYMTEAEILMSLKNYEALMLSAPKYCKECIKAGTPVTAVLDDFAQIVGHKAPILDRDVHKIASSLRRDSAVLVDPQGELSHAYAITIGRNPYEAVVAMTVLEKSAEIVLKASVIGGAKELGFFTVNTNRRKYLNKYSRAERRIADEKK